MKKYLMLAAALMWSTPAHSRNVVSNDGNELLELCSNSDYFSQGYCMGYIRALSSGVNLILYTGGKQICYQPNITVGQMRDVVVSYIRRNPQSRNKDAIVLVSWALAEAWPCQ